jgi:hypothetical protein
VYTVDLVVSDEVANDFERRGFRVKTLTVQDEVVGRSINIKRKVNGPGGMVRKAPLLLDANKVPLNEQVGNGSRVKIQYNEWEVSNKFGDFKGMDFQAMQVLELIQYKAGDGEEFEAIEGGEEF